MKIYHISSDFSNSHVYSQLVHHLDLLDLDQSIYSAVRTARESQYNPQQIHNIEKHLRHILKPTDKVFYRHKIYKIYHDFINVNKKLMNPSVIHAHTLYSDGGIALALRKNFNIPYIVTVRNTDINFFMKYRPDLNCIRNSILCNASKVIVPSSAYQRRLYSELPTFVVDEINSKLVIIPNGVDSFWLESSHLIERKDQDILKLLFVGRLTKDKNIYNLIKAVDSLSRKRKVLLTIVGRKGNDHKRIIKLAESEKYPFLVYKGSVENKEELRDLYLFHDIFVMPSFRETFGLVYIEAMSQGLPIIYSRGEGVDGYFKAGTVGEAVNPANIKDISDKIERLEMRKDDVREECIKRARMFKWTRIANEYKDIYMKISK